MSEKNSNNQNQSKQPTAEEIALKEAEQKKADYEQKLKDLEAKEKELKDKQAELDTKEQELSEKESNILFGGAKPVEEAIELNAEGLMTGNLDKEGKYPFNPSWNKGVVVRQVEVKQVDNDIVELPSTARLAVYQTDVYDELVRTKGFAGKKVTVLHDYRKTVQI